MDRVSRLSTRIQPQHSDWRINVHADAAGTGPGQTSKPDPSYVLATDSDLGPDPSCSPGAPGHPDDTCTRAPGWHARCPQPATPTPALTGTCAISSAHADTPLRHRTLLMKWKFKDIIIKHLETVMAKPLNHGWGPFWEQLLPHEAHLPTRVAPHNCPYLILPV